MLVRLKAAIMICCLLTLGCAGRRYAHPTKRTLEELRKDQADCEKVARAKACTYSDQSYCTNYMLRRKLEDECLKDRHGWTIDGERNATGAW
jgi:hypothetical protein